MRTSLQSLGGETERDRVAAPPAASGSLLAAGLAIAGYALWNARDVLGAWRHSPFDRCGSLAFALWLVPIAYCWVARRDQSRNLSSLAFAAALAISFLGAATEISALKYVGLAVALTGLLPILPATFAWLACAAAWMPGMGWAFSSHGVIAINSCRLGLGLVAAFLTPLLSRREPVY